MLWIADKEDSVVGRVADFAVEGERLAFVAAFHGAVVTVDGVGAVAFLAEEVQRLVVTPAQLVVVVAVGAHQVVAAQGSEERAADDESLVVAHVGIADTLAGDGRVHGEVEVGGGIRSPVGGEQQVGGAVTVDGLHDAEVAPRAAHGTREGRRGVEATVERKAAIGRRVHVVGLGAGRERYAK